MRTTLIALLLSLFFFQSSFGMSIAELKKMPLPNNRIIKITGHPIYPPYVWKEKNKDELTGIAIELLTRAFAEINVKAEVVFVDTWGRAQEEVKLGHIDILVPPYKNAERVKFFNFTKKPIFMDETAIFVKKGHEFNFKKLSDLKAHKGVALINDSFGTEFDNYDKTDLHLTRLTSTDQLLQFLNIGRTDYVVAGLYAGLSVMRKLKITDSISILPKRVITTGMYAPISLASPWNKDVIEKYLDEKISEYEAKGIVKALEKKYLEKMKEDEK